MDIAILITLISIYSKYPVAAHRRDERAPADWGLR
jgi:hypothetical protein